MARHARGAWIGGLLENHPNHHTRPEGGILEHLGVPGVCLRPGAATGRGAGQRAGGEVYRIGSILLRQAGDPRAEHPVPEAGRQSSRRHQQGRLREVDRRAGPRGTVEEEGSRADKVPGDDLRDTLARGSEGSIAGPGAAARKARGIAQAGAKETRAAREGRRRRVCGRVENAQEESGGTAVFDRGDQREADRCVGGQ